MKSRLPRVCTAGLLLIAALVCAGCTQRRETAVTATPMPEELAPLPQLERIISATVAVEGRHEAPVAPLLPPFPEPGPTPAERKVLGTDLPGFSFLKYPNAVPPPLSRRIGSFVAGPTVGIWDFGGISGAVMRFLYG